ncbi:MAG TPA: hypothetical protein VGL02_01280 [Streptomyces sp.]
MQQPHQFETPGPAVVLRDERAGEQAGPGHGEQPGNVGGRLAQESQRLVAAAAPVTQQQRDALCAGLGGGQERGVRGWFGGERGHRRAPVRAR